MPRPPIHRPAKSVTAAAALTLTLSLAACSPALDWRDTQPEGFGLSLSLPCRAAVAQRTLDLAGAPVDLTLHACSADGATFAIASASVAEPRQVAAALAQLAAAAVANVQGEIRSQTPAQVAGMTPQPAAQRLRIAGHLRDGSAVDVSALVFAHGLRVFQASVVAPGSSGGGSDDARGTFLDSLRVRP
jgi:hypothetical protein